MAIVCEDLNVSTNINPDYEWANTDGNDGDLVNLLPSDIYTVTTIPIFSGKIWLLINSRRFWMMISFFFSKIAKYVILL